MNKIIKCSRGAGLSSVVFAPVETIILGRRGEDGLEDQGAIDPVDAARQEAEMLVAAARAEADSIREAAYAQGYESGVQDGVRSVDGLIERLQADIAQVAADRARLVEDVEPEVLKLCVEAVEKVIRHEVRTDPRVVMRVIKSCLRRITASGDLHIRVSPQEIEDVKAQRDELLGSSEVVRSVSIVSDRRVEPGGCVVEATAGTYDARLQTQIDKLKESLGRQAD